MMNRENIERTVIEEFGEQWTHYTENDGYYASVDCLADHLGPLARPEYFRDKVVADIGSGTGRIVMMLAAAGAAKVVAVEPSVAMVQLKKNIGDIAGKVVCLNERGDQWSYPEIDCATSIGVLHHIVDPVPTVQNVFRQLKPGGKFIIWLYGREGNELYLTVVEPLRKLTPKIPHFALAALVWALYLPLNAYTFLCRWLPLPMRGYFRDHIARLDHKTRRVTIYDQLNPSWAKYYTRAEAEALLADNGFVDVQSYHRHGYSWTVIGTRPAQGPA